MNTIKKRTGMPRGIRSKGVHCVIRRVLALLAFVLVCSQPAFSVFGQAQTKAGGNIFDFGTASTQPATTQTAVPPVAEVPTTQAAKPDSVLEGPATKPATSGAESVLTPAPDGAEQREAMMRLRDAFGTELDSTRRPEEKLKLSTKLLQAGTDEHSDMAGRYMLLILASDYAAAGGDLDSAWRAIDVLGTTHRIDTLKLKTDAAVSVAKVLRAPPDRKQLAEALLPQVEQAIQQDRYDQAIQLADLAVSVGRLSGDPQTSTTAVARLQLARELKSAYNQIAPAVEMLHRQPADPDANLKVGRFRCLLKEDWAGGLPLMARGGKDGLVTLAVRDLAGAASPRDQIALGDGWWEQGERESGGVKSALRRHASTWYRLALVSVEKGLLREKIEHRIQLVDNAAESGVAQVAAIAPAEQFKWKIDDLGQYQSLQVTRSWQATRPRTTLTAQSISTSLVLSHDKSPYLVTGVLLINPRATLTIEPGVVVLFAPQSKIDNQGKLVAVSDAAWIVLAGSEKDAWTGVDSRGTVQLRRCLTVGAGQAFVTHDNAEGLTADQCIFANNNETLSFGNEGRGTVKDCLFLRNGTGPFGHGDSGTVNFSNCLLLFNGRGCTGNFYGKTIGSNCTFYGNTIGIEAAERGDFVHVTLSNILSTTGKPLGSRGGKAVVAGNYWGANRPVDPKHDISSPLGKPVSDAFPNLPPCEYLAQTR